MLNRIPKFPVAVVIERTALANRWVSEQWRIVAVVPDEREAREAAVVERIDADNGTRWIVGGHAIELHRTEAEGYFLNISTPEPKAFVMWRNREAGDDAPDGIAIAAQLVSVSYNEAGRLLDGGEQVEAVPLAQAIRAWMEPFVVEHYKPEPKRKSKRNQLYERDRDGGPAPESNERR
jgi:uncharacterized protein DUF3305